VVSKLPEIILTMHFLLFLTSLVSVVSGTKSSNRQECVVCFVFGVLKAGRNEPHSCAVLQSAVLYHFPPSLLFVCSHTHTLWRWRWNSHCFEGWWCLHRQVQAQFLDCLTVKVKAPQSFVMSAAACPATQYYILEGLNLCKCAVRTTYLAAEESRSAYWQ
jgi:hypothetical protein